MAGSEGRRRAAVWGTSPLPLCVVHFAKWRVQWPSSAVVASGVRALGGMGQVGPLAAATWDDETVQVGTMRMPDEPEVETGSEEHESAEDAVKLLTSVPGVGPKTAQKLVEQGYTTLESIAQAEAEDLAGAVAGLSVSKARALIEQAAALVEAIASGLVEPVTQKRGKRKRAPEPEPVVHILPPPEDIVPDTTEAVLKSGYALENEEMGIPIGPRWLTKFEKARIIGARALQISMGAPILIDRKTAPKELFALAEAELKAGRLPMTVRRTAPTGEYYDIDLNVLLKHTRLD